jgi:hypothetical protein
LPVAKRTALGAVGPEGHGETFDRLAERSISPGALAPQLAQGGVKATLRDGVLSSVPQAEGSAVGSPPGVT